MESQKERVIHLSELRNYVNIFYGNSILMKRENIKYLPQNSKVMKRFPEGHIPQHAPIPGRQYNTIKLKQTEWGKSTFARVVTIVSKQLMNIRLSPFH